ncbi:cytochrome P450 [Polymorphobacter arshaanensis]|uniref:Cytochrome P450 n=1 Tax=Glacieibacterium arshaanense TaxID=2511025 RepID=A0A4Y9EQK6_9SPHN|nr:cytochrome P450 [Polymorphobacter arshaanensis]TFU05493.1 cytochrome P450 [Polymorphobacter arshaanensis]
MNLAFDTSLVDVDLIPEGKGPPLELFARWRREDPVHWNPPPAPGTYSSPQVGATLDKGFWVLTRYKDVDTVSRNQQLFSSWLGSPIIWDYDEEALARQRAGMMGMDPDRHLRTKRLVTPIFMPRVINELEPEIARVAKSIVDDVAAAGRCEFVFDVASRLPVYTFCKLLGVPDGDRDLIFKLGNLVADTENADTDHGQSVMQLMEYALRLAAEKAANPDGTMMSNIVNGEVDGDKLAPEEVAMFFVLLSIAGHETTRTTAVHFIRLMTEYPDQYALLRSDPERYLPNAIDEVLRFSPPVIKFRRTATQDTMIGERAVKAGDKIYLSYAAANRDPGMFEDPDRFDITRANASKHLSFGIGPHICLGARLASMQLKHLLMEVITRIPDFRIVGEPTYLRSLWFSAILNMPIEFTPERK